MKKVLLLNGSPRKNWNTHKLLLEAERGAKENGAETKLVHLFDLNFTDCKSCFACKVKGSKTNGVCALRDELRPILEYAWDADAIIIGSPAYYSNMTAPAKVYALEVGGGDYPDYKTKWVKIDCPGVEDISPDYIWGCETQSSQYIVSQANGASYRNLYKFTASEKTATLEKAYKNVPNLYTDECPTLAMK